MDSLIKIGMIGSYKCDMILFMSRIINALDLNAAVVDATNEEYLKYCIPNYLRESVVTYLDTDFYLNCSEKAAFEELQLSKYNVVLIDFGFNKKLASYLIECKIIINVTNMERINVIKLADMIKAISNCNQGTKYGQTGYTKQINNNIEVNKKLNAVKIYRDFIDCKIDFKYIDKLLEIEESFCIVKSYMFGYDEDVERCNIESQYNDFFKFAKLPKQVKLMLFELVAEHMEQNPKLVCKALKRSERGG